MSTKGYHGSSIVFRKSGEYVLGTMKDASHVPKGKARLRFVVQTARNVIPEGHTLSYLHMLRTNIYRHFVRDELQTLSFDNRFRSKV